MVLVLGEKYETLSIYVTGFPYENSNSYLVGKKYSHTILIVFREKLYEK